MTKLRLGWCYVVVYLLGTPGVLGQTVQFVPGSTTPRVQLTGEHFQIYANGRYFTEFTPARTLSRFGVLGTDLGIPVSFADKTVLLFGDTVAVYPSGSQYRQARPGPNGAGDSIGYIPNADFSQCHYIAEVDRQLAQGVATPNVSSAACPSLSVYTDPARAADGQVFKPMAISGLLAGETQGVLRVPTGGFAYNDRLYMFYITMGQEASGADFALQSVVARSDQPAASWSNAAPPTFSRLYTASSHPPIADPANPPSEAGDVGKFMFASAVVMDAAKIAGAGLTPGLPAALQTASNVVFVFGTSWRRKGSNMYVAAFSLTDADAGPAKWFYYKGGNQWTANEAESAPLLATSNVSEQSVVWNSALRRFVLMRTGNASVQAQFATSPWGPWSDPVNLLSNSDAWIAKLLHHPGADPLVQSLIPIYDRNGNQVALPDSETGVPYSPSLLDTFTQNADGSVTLYYTLSMWNPYQVFLMSSTVVIPGTMTLDKTSLTFAAVSTGTAFTSQTPAQTVRLAQGGAGAITWTATSTTPWLIVSPASGSGPATLSISTRFTSGLTASQTGSITVALTGASSNTAGPISVRLTTVSASAPAAPPFGAFDTPAGDSTVLAGSIAVTGWTLDNIGVQRVELWRDLQPGETTAPFSSTPADPRHGKVFIASPTFVDGARPDIEGLYPLTPANHRGGWGYLMLTWGLWNQGNGTYRLYAFAFDQENNVATIGAKTVIVNNNAATKPFGAIDTPAVGGDASGPNFGWGLTPKVNGAATCKIPSNGVQVSIDSGPLQPVVYGDARADIAGAFPGFSNSAAAGGYFIFDWPTLTNGLHTISWLITDDCNRADGVGSRFFNVTNGVSALTASSDAQFRLKAETSPDAQFRLKAETTRPDRGVSQIDPVVSAFRRNGAVADVSAFRRNDDVLVARGYGELSEIVTPDDTGDRTVEVKQGDRIEIRLPRGFHSAHQLDAVGQPRGLPTGTTWDEASGIFYWQPAPAFLGRYRLVFSNGSERITVGVAVRP